MKEEICKNCKHCLSCMCGDEFEDCFIKHPDMKSKIIHIVISSALLFFSLTASAQTIDQVRAELHRQNVPHANIVLAQARLETGNFTSRRCRVDHNLFGMKRGKRYAKYRSWQDSVRDYKERISSRYKGGDYYAFLHRIGYASDKRYTAKVHNIINTSK